MLEALAETRREGGLGVLLAHGLTASADYAYLFGRNRIRLILSEANPTSAEKFFWAS